MIFYLNWVYEKIIFKRLFPLPLSLPAVVVVALCRKKHKLSRKIILLKQTSNQFKVRFLKLFQFISFYVLEKKENCCFWENLEKNSKFLAHKNHNFSFFWDLKTLFISNKRQQLEKTFFTHLNFSKFFTSFYIIQFSLIYPFFQFSHRRINTDFSFPSLWIIKLQYFIQFFSFAFCTLREIVSKAE